MKRSISRPITRRIIAKYSPYVPRAVKLLIDEEKQSERERDVNIFFNPIFIATVAIDKIFGDLASMPFGSVQP